MAGPLEGIKVVDVSAVVSGPLCTMMMGDQGADVVKIEAHGMGDTLRLPLFAKAGLASFFMNCNRNKRGIVLDLGQDEGREIVHKLVADADVFIQNWRPGAAARLGLGYDDLKAIQPDLIYCSISGYGPTGPYSQNRVYDPIIQGLSGHTAVQLNPEFPMRDLVRNIVCDKSSAYTALQAITAALFARERGAGGQHIEVPMVDASLYFFWADGGSKHTWLCDEQPPGRALYEIYRLSETADGHLVYFAASDQEFQGLCRAIGKPEWAEDPDYYSAEARAKGNAIEIVGIEANEVISNTPTREMIERLKANDVPCGPVLSLEEMPDDPQLQHNESFIEFEHPVAGPYRGIRPAARFEKTPQDPRRHFPPMHGEHTEEVLRELGYGDGELKRMRESGLIPSG